MARKRKVDIRRIAVVVRDTDGWRYMRADKWGCDLGYDRLDGQDSAYPTVRAALAALRKSSAVQHGFITHYQRGDRVRRLKVVYKPGMGQRKLLDY